ncbi:MAG TPA: sulfur carrier protein ThiS [Candidatus Rubrimentiphilum sp.]|nr:sulfur carrier protein ThiS [Candidatus Rubrimentiphilum sp.]
MRATINGEVRELPDGMTMERLLAHIQAPERGVAVAKNDRVVRRAAFAQEIVEDGDRVEIIRAVAGG